MAEVEAIECVQLFCGLIAVDEETIARASEELALLFGEIDLESDISPFDFTDYYNDEMGTGLLRKFVSFVKLVDQGNLSDIKIQTNRIENDLAAESGGRIRRKVNLDPGYITAAKLVLATTKDFAHRIYLRDGIFAEITLNFGKGERVVAHKWTYPDFKSGLHTSFFLEVRRRFMKRRAGQGSLKMA